MLTQQQRYSIATMLSVNSTTAVLNRVLAFGQDGVDFALRIAPLYRGHDGFIPDTVIGLESLDSLYSRAANPAESFPALLHAVDSVFAPLSADDSKRLAVAFGINTPCRSKRAALVAVRRRIEDRLESAQRCQF